MITKTAPNSRRSCLSASLGTETRSQVAPRRIWAHQRAPREEDPDGRKYLQAPKAAETIDSITLSAKAH